MAIELTVAAPFSIYARGAVITDPGTVVSILAGPYADQVTRRDTSVSGGVSGGSSGGGSSGGSTSATTLTAGTGLLITGSTISLGTIPLANLAASTALSGQALAFNGTAWAPATLPALPTFTGTAPIIVSGGTISLAQSGATVGQTLVWSGSAWLPATISGGGGAAYVLPAATSSGLGGVKSDGGATTTIAGDGTISVVLSRRITSLPSDADIMVRLADGSLAVIAQSLVTASSGTAAPGQVGSLAAGTPTSTTIPLTWTAPTTGTGPFTYAVQQSPHGAGTWTSAAGAFGATGGTVTGLIAATNYDFRAIVTGSGGTSTTALTSGIATAAAGTSAAAVQLVSGMPTSGTAIYPLAQGQLIFSNILTAWVCLYHGGADEGARVPFGGGQLPGLTPQDVTGGTYTIRAYDAPTGGSCFWESGAITVAANPNRVGGSMTITPAWTGAWKTTASSGGNLTNSDNYLDSNQPMSAASIYASLSGTIPPDQPGGGGSNVLGSRTNIVDSNNRRLYVSDLYATGNGQVYIWVIAVSALDGTTTRALLSSISPIALGTVGTASSFSVALSSASGAVGDAVTMTVSPVSGSWPASTTVTPTVTGLTGTFSPTSANPTGTAAITFAFTSSGSAASGTLNATATGMTSTGSKSYAAGSYPALSMSGDTYETAAPISGSGSLKTGSGSVQLTAPAGCNALTIEGFLKCASGFSGQDPLFNIGSNGGGVSFGFGGDHNLRVTNGGNTQYNPALPTGTHHVALVWAGYGGGAYHLFLDGTEVNTSGNATQSTMPAPGSVSLAIALPSDGSVLLDSLRVSTGARYTATFTAPSAPLAVDASTLDLWQFNGNANGG